MVPDVREDAGLHEYDGTVQNLVRDPCCVATLVAPGVLRPSFDRNRLWDMTIEAIRTLSGSPVADVR